MKELRVGTREFLRNFNKLVSQNMPIRVTHRGQELGVFEPFNAMKLYDEGLRKNKFSLGKLKKYLVPLKDGPKNLSQNIDKILYDKI